MALMKLCKCGRKVPITSSKCDACQEVHNRDELKRKRAGYKKYNDNRDQTVRKFYGSKAWRRTRETIKNRDKGLCLVCKYNFKYIFMECVHHITPLREAQTLGLDPSNLISVCSGCHDLIHELYNTKLKSTVQNELKKILQDQGGPKSLG